MSKKAIRFPLFGGIFNILKNLTYNLQFNNEDTISKESITKVCSILIKNDPSLKDDVLKLTSVGIHNLSWKNIDFLMTI